jgi:hypothetical protein
MRRTAAKFTALFCGLLAIGALAAPLANAQVTLKPQVKPGEMSKTTSEARTAQTLSIAGMDVITSSEQTTVASSSNGPKAADGSVTSRSKVDSLKANLSLPGGVNIQFDSANPEATGDAGMFNIIVDLLKAVAATEYDVKTGKDGRVVDVKVVSNAAAGLSAEARKMYEERVNPAALRDAANEELNRLPKGPVKPGDKWEYTNKARLDSGQSLTFQEEHVFKGEETAGGKKAYRVDITAKTVTYAIDPAGGLPLSVKSSDLKVTESAGHYLFDPERGGVAEAASKSRIQGDMVFVIMGMELPGKLDLTIESKSKTE